jgi:hypothetical protein
VALPSARVWIGAGLWCWVGLVRRHRLFAVSRGLPQRTIGRR